MSVWWTNPERSVDTAGTRLERGYTDVLDQTNEDYLPQRLTIYTEEIVAMYLWDHYTICQLSSCSWWCNMMQLDWHIPTLCTCITKCMAVWFVIMVQYGTIIVPSVIYSTVIVQSTGWTITHSLYTALGALMLVLLLDAMCNYIIFIYTGSVELWFNLDNDRQKIFRVEIWIEWI